MTVDVLDSQKPLQIKQKVQEANSETKSTISPPADASTKQKQPPLKMAAPLEPQKATQLDLLVAQIPNTKTEREHITDMKVVEQHEDFKSVVKYLQRSCSFQNVHEQTTVALWMWINGLSSLQQVSPETRPTAFRDLSKPQHQETRLRVFEAMRQVHEAEVQRKQNLSVKNYMRSVMAAAEISMQNTHEIVIRERHRRYLPRRELCEDEEDIYEK